jgi:crossover junction endodeoxyribonuclease RusA
MSARAPLLEPAADGATWPCGHPRTAANTQAIGKAGERCKICRREIAREGIARQRAAFVVRTGWPSRLLSPNGPQRNFWARRKARRLAKDEGYIATVQAMPKGWALAPGDRLKVTIYAEPPTNRRRDDDNAVASAKNFLDGIAQRLGIDDSRFDLQPVRWREPSAPGALYFRIEPAR